MVVDTRNAKRNDVCERNEMQRLCVLYKYEYDETAEDAYRESLFKTFKKNVQDDLFPFMIVDSINYQVNQFKLMWSFAKQNGFEVDMSLKVFRNDFCLIEVLKFIYGSE